MRQGILFFALFSLFFLANGFLLFFIVKVGLLICFWFGWNKEEKSLCRLLRFLSFSFSVFFSEEFLLLLLPLKDFEFVEGFFFALFKRCGGDCVWH